MLSPETILTLQGFAYGIAQNLISSAIVEWKKTKDDEHSQENAAWLEKVEHSKMLQSRIEQAICRAFQNSKFTTEQFRLMLPLSSDPIFGGELASQLLSNTYSAESIQALIRQCSPASETLGAELILFASSLLAAIQNAIADDPHLHRVKELQFQTNITAQVAEVKADTAGTREAIRETGQVVVEAITQQLQALIGQMPLSDETSEFQVREKIYHDRVEQARKLMEVGKPKTAQRLLEELRLEISSQNPSKALLFRIATNIGGCAVQLDDQQTAIREIDLAFQLDPENPKAISNLSITTLLKGKPEEALQLAERARKLVVNDSVATANYIHALFALKREVEVEELIKQEGWIAKDTNCCFVIGTLYFNRGRFSEAEKFFRFGIKSDPQEPRLLVHLAHSLVRPIQAALLGEPVFNWRFPIDAKPILEQAEGLLTQAITLQAEFEDRRFLAFSHLLRADVRRMLRMETTAIADCQIALHENPSDESPLSIKALAHFQAREFPEAAVTFERITKTETKKQILLQQAMAYNASNKSDKAIDLLLPHWQIESTEDSQIGIADQLLWAYSESGNHVEAEKVISKLQSGWPKAPEALAAIAHYRAQNGAIEEAIGLFSEALAYAVGPRRDFISLELASIFYARNEFSKAAELLESVADLTTDNDLSRQYLVCLYNSGPHNEALKITQRIRGGGNPIAVISQIEANILAEIGDLKTAQQLMERLSQLNPKLRAYRISAAEFAMRRGQHDDARRILQGISYKEILPSADLLFRIAKLRAVLGMGDVLEYSYQARRADFNSPQTHAAYVWLFVSREQVDGTLQKDVVDDDCGVILRIGGERRTYTILSEAHLHGDRGEISPSQAKTMDLMGRKKNDKFVFDKDAFGNAIECEILEVQSKYVRAFQETLEKFPSLFPKDRTLQGIHGPYETFRDGLLRQLDEQQDAFRRIASFYEARQATFESLATVLRCSPIELWGMLTGGKYCAFANFSGAQADAEIESDTAAKADSILLDLTAVLTFAELGLLDKLSKRYKLFATQPVFDIFAQAYGEAALSKPGMTFGKVGDNYIRQETTAEQLASRKAFFERIIKFLRENVVTLAVPTLLENNEFTKELREFLGPISTSTLLAARAEKLALHSEDQMLRVLARNEWKISGVSAQPLLNELVSKGVLSKDECVEAKARLFFMNFSAVLISAENLMWTLKKLDYRLTEDTKKMLALFHGPQCTFESAVEVLAEATKRLWLENPLYHLKLDLLDAFLDALGTNRPTKQVAEHFTLAIKFKLFLAPNVADAIARHAQVWKERKLGRAGIIISPRSAFGKL